MNERVNILIWIGCGISLAILFFPSWAQADPWLVSDPVDCEDSDRECPVTATILANGTELVANHPVESDYSIALDLITWPVGKITYTAINFDQYGRPSEESDPFVLKEVSGKPTGLKVVVSKP